MSDAKEWIKDNGWENREIFTKAEIIDAFDGGFSAGYADGYHDGYHDG